MYKHHNRERDALQCVFRDGALNDKITNGDIQDMILVQEAMQEKKIAE